ncbi:hypothetical protein NQZ79_g7649 [Umbelopsis isabellina]|nr:hypothetical protein NQZ79_g7649 [Umbelopsis isabellina]
MITGHIVSKDIQCSNGIIHVIDAVLLPPKKAPLTIMHHPELAAFSNITQSNNLTNILSSHQTTIFAPNNAAWGNFSYSTQPMGILIRDVKYQVAHGVFRSTDLSTGSLTSISGQQIKVDTSNGSVTINGAHIIQADVLTSEGVIHIIDKVIDPVTATTSIDPSATQHYHTTPSMIPASHNSGSGLSHPNCTLFSLFVLILQNLIFLL